MSKTKGFSSSENLILCQYPTKLECDIYHQEIGKILLLIGLLLIGFNLVLAEGNSRNKIFCYLSLPCLISSLVFYLI